jgi:hypothetical protein
MSIGKKYANRWKKKVEIKKAVEEYSGSGSRIMRTITGNYKGTIRDPPKSEPGSHKKLMRKHLLALTQWIMKKPVNTPTLYKGLSKANANQFRKTGKFTTRTPTSTSKNRFQALTFTNRSNDPILLVIPPGKHNAMILGEHGIISRQPREQEVILAPGIFKYSNRNKTTGNYMVNYIPTGRSIPRRRNFII